MKNWVCDGLDFLLGAVGGLLCARGRRAEAAPVALSLETDESRL